MCLWIYFCITLPSMSYLVYMQSSESQNNEKANEGSISSHIDYHKAGI